MRALREQRGTSLLEIVVGLGLGALLMMSIMGLWRTSQEAYLDGSDAADAQQVLRVAMDRLTKVVLRAGHDPTGAGIVAFANAGDAYLRVRADLTGAGGVPDGLTNDEDENVRFDWIAAQGILRQNTLVGGDQDLAVNVVANPNGAPTFQYFDAAGAALPAGGGAGMTAANMALIRLVRITLTLRRVSQGQTVNRTLVTDVRLRNLQ